MQYQGGLAGHGEGGQELDGVHLDGTTDAAAVVGGHVPSPCGREVSIPRHHHQVSPLTHQDTGVICQGWVRGLTIPGKTKPEMGVFT